MLPLRPDYFETCLLRFVQSSSLESNRLMFVLSNFPQNTKSWEVLAYIIFSFLSTQQNVILYLLL